MGRPIESSSANQQLTVRDERTGKTYTIPIKNNTIPASAFKAIRASRVPGEREENETERGLRVSDRGFLNTAVIQSSIAYIDGDNGVLRYRGYPIEQLATQSSFLEVAYLLIYGSLPTSSQYSLWTSEIESHSAVHVDAEGFFRSFRYDAHPMAIMTSAFSAMGSYYAEANPALQGQTLYTKGDFDSLANMDKQIYRLVGKATTLAAMAYRVRQGRPFVQPPVGMSYTASLLYMLDHLSAPSFAPHPVLAKALDVLFILHADHEMNASTTSVLQVGSSLVDPWCVVGAGCASLYGPLHGGANEAVIRMLIAIGAPENVPAFVEKVKKKETVLSGFGHRVYKTSDPRSHIILQLASTVFSVTGSDPLLETAMTLRDVAMQDEYFTARKLAPNVDFWSGLIYRAMGFPLDFFPVLFAVPRVVGWLAHWRQMMLGEEGVKIWRPRQVYVGEGRREYVPIARRLDAGGEELKTTPKPVVHTGMGKRMKLASWDGKEKSKL